jgi:hypothetical protein
MVTVCGAELAARSILPKVSAELDTLIGETPCPERVAVSVPLAVLVERTFNVPVRAPAAVGVNTMLTAQLAFGAIDPEQLVGLATEKSPVMATLEMLRGMRLVLVQIMVCAVELLPTRVLG